MKENIAKSIKAKLLHISKEENISYQLMIIRYFQERLLYRLSLSEFKNNFCLKGGVLLYLLDKKKSRPTIDIDFLAINTDNEQNYIKCIFSEICKIEYKKDAVTFDSQNIIVTEIGKRANYSGIRINLTGKLDTIKQRIQIDIGFGDKVYPKPLIVSFPVILDMEQPIIQVYSIYSAISEKFEAMIQLSEANSRMKDFYDIYTLLINHKIDKDELENTIKITFKTRNTIYTENHSIFNNTFYTNKDKLKQWDAFKRKVKGIDSLSFEKVLIKIKTELEPIYNRIH
ncbi:MAG: nucleotidyl transferase AbiEii/AbiGii toxin family protein [Bacteroidales bacterium]|nr:nucleotidyl transferase AbiEii/AbiGii toxin family protein [Bacteroidales bacterium]